MIPVLAIARLIVTVFKIERLRDWVLVRSARMKKKKLTPKQISSVLVLHVVSLPGGVVCCFQVLRVQRLTSTAGLPLPRPSSGNELVDLP
jgi:hypothetical protein